MPLNSTKTYCRMRFMISQTISLFCHSQPRDTHEGQWPPCPAQHVHWHLPVLLYYCLSLTENPSSFVKILFFLWQMGHRRGTNIHQNTSKKLKLMIALGLLCSKLGPALSETPPNILAVTEKSLRLTKKLPKASWLKNMLCSRLSS